MTKLTQQVKQGAGQALASLSQGWRELRERAGGALTRFRGGRRSSEGVDSEMPSFGSWGLMAADVADADDSVVVRVEAPGMSRSDFKIELRDATLRIEGDKRVEHEFERDGQHTIECAYGSFRRDVPLPAAVNPDKARASYRDGVLKIVLPKITDAQPRRLPIRVN